MSRVALHGHGVYCEMCQEVYEGTEGCEHELRRKMGVQKDVDGGYLAAPEDMGHYSPHQFMLIDEMMQCVECGAVQIPPEMVQEAGLA